MSVKELERKLRKIPAEKIQEVDRFLNSILNGVKKTLPKKPKKISFKGMEGILAEGGKKHTSVEVQHLIWEEEMKKYESKKR
jgi:uncharacterized radical SAM superfamily protein